MSLLELLAARIILIGHIVLYRDARSRASARRAAGRGTSGGEETSRGSEFVERCAATARRSCARSRVEGGDGHADA
jgi:hypothetical protein